MPTLAESIAENLARLHDRIAQAAARSGRSSEAIQVVAVTKYVDAPIARLLFEAGCHDLAESRPQVFWKKVADLSDLPVHWHLIGNLQRNKIRRCLPAAEWIHSVNSLRLLQTIDQEAARAACCPKLFLEINISGEPAKQGLDKEGLEQILSVLEEYPHVQVKGLMGMASLAGGADAAREQFSTLRKMRDQLARSRFPEITELSMGMSGDFEIAIEEGATFIRIGSLLTEGIEE